MKVKSFQKIIISVDVIQEKKQLIKQFIFEMRKKHFWNDSFSTPNHLTT
jgi:hypothetical protein